MSSGRFMFSFSAVPFLALSALMSSVSVVHAAEIYTLWSDLGPESSDKEGDGGGWGLFGRDVQFGPLTEAFAFSIPNTNGDSFQITALRLPLGGIPGNGHRGTVVLADNNGNNEPGKRLFEYSVDMPHKVCCAKMLTIKLTKHVVLRAIHQYWITVLPSAKTKAYWPGNYRGNGIEVLESDSTDNGKSWFSSLEQNAAAFAVYGTPAK